MPYNPDIHNRRSIRLKDYDYTSPGAYYITACTEGRVHLFGEIQDTLMEISEYGSLVQTTWNGLVDHYSNIALDSFIVMPNHIHGIIIITQEPHSSAPLAKRHALPEIVRAFKSFSARRINELRNTSTMKVWQRDYYEHVIRDEDELRWIRAYIENNPAGWKDDIDNITTRL